MSKSKKVIYEFTVLEGQNGHIGVGYTRIAITNGEAQIDESDSAVMELVRQNGGAPSRVVWPTKAEGSKSKK